MATFPLLMVDFVQINRAEAVDDIDKLCKFHYNLTTNADSHKQEMQIFNLKWLLFPY